MLNPAVPLYPKVRFDQQGAWTQAAPARRAVGRNPPLTAFSVPVDRYDCGWDPHEREEAVWRDPSSRHQILVGNNADVIPLDDQQILTDKEEDTADPQYFPGRRRAQELDPDQSDIEDQFLARVRPSSAARSVYQLRDQLLLLQRVLLHPAHQLGRVIRKSAKVFVSPLLHHLQRALEDRNQQVPKFGFNKNLLTLKQHFLVSELPVHVSIHLQVLTYHLCHKLSSGGIKTRLVLIRLAIPSYPRRENLRIHHRHWPSHLLLHRQITLQVRLPLNLGNNNT